MMEDLVSKAWKNLNGDSKELDGKTIINPTKIGGIYPLSIKGLSNGNRICVYLGQHQLYKRSRKKTLFSTKEEVIDQINYHLYHAHGNLVWNGDERLSWPVGISAEFLTVSDEENAKGIEKKFGEILEEIRSSGINEMKN